MINNLVSFLIGLFGIRVQAALLSPLEIQSLEAEHGSFCQTGLEHSFENPNSKLGHREGSCLEERVCRACYPKHQRPTENFEHQIAPWSHRVEQQRGTSMTSAGFVYPTLLYIQTAVLFLLALFLIIFGGWVASVFAFGYPERIPDLIGKIVIDVYAGFHCGWNTPISNPWNCN